MNMHDPSAVSSKDTIDTLNGLIETTKDGEIGFRQAADHAHAPDLRKLLNGYSADCARSAGELQQCVIGLGGKAETGGTAVGALHRGWVNLKASMTTDDDLMLLEECERGEDHAKAAYGKALKTPMTDSLRSLLKRHWDGTVAHHDQIRDLRNRGRAAADAS